MPVFITPVNVAFVAIAVLVILALIPTAKTIRHKLTLGRRFVLLEVPAVLTQGLDSNKFLRDIPVPFVFETAVHHLGKDVHYYLALPRSKAVAVRRKFGFIEAPEYNIYHSGGSELGFSVKTDIWPSLNFKDIDFSRVNEVGEGVLVQLVVKSRSKKSLAQLRVLISAPTPYQAQEIALGLNASLSSLKLTPVTKNFPQFLHQVTFRGLTG